MSTPTRSYVAFAGPRPIERGALAPVALAAKRVHDTGVAERVVVYDEQTGRVEDVDLHGTPDEVAGRLERIAAAAAASAARKARVPVKRAGPGRPALGVVSREVTLLPRHWEWLAQQRGGASAALRALVDAARKANPDRERTRQAVEAAYHFMVDIAGDLPGFEDASRALFAHDFAGLDARTSAWPAGIREQLARFTERARAGVEGTG